MNFLFNFHKDTFNNKSKNQEETKYSYILMIILIFIGVLLLFSFYIIDKSTIVKHYKDLASSDNSGFRFLVFMGILKYGLLIAGLTFIVTTVVLFIRKLIK